MDAQYLSEESLEEVEVIRSIYSDEGDVYFDDESSALSVQCYVKLPSKTITVLCDLKDENDTDESVYKQDVSYLPPVTITCVFSDTYPTHSNLSSIRVNCIWLSNHEVDAVEKHLESFWSAGQPVIYDMISWIEDGILEFFDIYDVIDFSDSEKSYEMDQLMQISILNEFNQLTLQKKFKLDSHECVTCFCEYPGTEMCLLQCSHCYCMHCIATLVNVQYGDGKFCEVNCSVCGVFVGRNIVKMVLSESEFKRWEEGFINQSVELDSSILFCPRCRQYAVRDKDRLGQCFTCNFNFCDSCLEAWHPGNCETFSNNPETQQSESELNEEQIRKEAHKKNERLTRIMMKGFMTKCPKCLSWILRNQGCNHMTCSICRTSFCYACGSQYVNGSHYGGITCDGYVPNAPQDVKFLDQEQKHFMDSFQDIERSPEIEIVQNPITHDDKGEITTCVKCRSKIQRKNQNNHARCAVCKVEFCFLCRSLVKGTAHFSPATCHQHGQEIMKH